MAKSKSHLISSKKPTATTAAAADALAPRTLIFDNGAHTIKAGFSVPGTSPSPSTDCQVIPNCIARSQRDKITYVASELDACGDFGELQLRRPVERGYVVNWEGEKAVWERALRALRCDGAEGEWEVGTTNFIVTEAANSTVGLQRNVDEMVFEEFGFGAAWRVVGPLLCAYAAGEEAPAECLLVVDVGHSHTTVTPLYCGRVLHTACRRLDVGGKVLTNHLKDLLTRVTDMHREDWICQEIKEDVCFVAASPQEFGDMLDKTWKGGKYDAREIDTSIVVDYVLPDYEDIKRGFARPHDPSKSARLKRLGIGGQRESVLPIGNERFTVPELLFTPSDIGMQQQGLTGTIMQSMEVIPKGLWQAFLGNVLVVGGTSKMPGFTTRLEAELRSIVSDEYVVRVVQAPDPVKNIWLGGAQVAQNEELLQKYAVTQAEYFEHGELWTRRKFAGKLGGR